MEEDSHELASVQTGVLTEHDGMHLLSTVESPSKLCGGQCQGDRVIGGAVANVVPADALISRLVSSHLFVALMQSNCE